MIHASRSKRTHPNRRHVYIVYGHDHIRDELASFLRRLGVEPILLCDQAREGRTLVEAIEHHLKRADFVIALLTPDDEGHRAGHAEEKKLRARQNVVLELGIALGLLGRKRILVLYRRGVELPSDLQGLHYVELTTLADVRLRIVQELKAAGINVDANRAF